MHVGFITREYPPLPSGGIGTMVRSLSRSLVAQGHRVTVIGWSERADFDDHGVHIRFLGRTPVPKMGWLWTRHAMCREINRLIREEGLQIVEAPDSRGITAGFCIDCPIVIRCHGSATYFADLNRERIAPTTYWAEKLALNQAQGIKAVSRFTAEATRRLFNLGDAIGVIPNGVDIERFRPTTDETEPDLLLYCGTLIRKKGVFDLCRIFSRLVEYNCNARLWIVGPDTKDQIEGVSTWYLCQQHLSKKARERTCYFGFRHSDEMPSIINRASICVFPSYAEAFPMSWIEAMACGKPIVAYDIGWAGEIIRDRETGRLARTGDIHGFSQILCELLADTNQREDIGISARSSIMINYTIDKIAEESLRWYNKVLM